MIDQRFEELLGGLLDGELTSDELSELVRLAEDDPSRHQELQQQLESAELIVLSEDELRDAPLFVSAIQTRLGEDAFVSRVQTAIRSGGRHGGRRPVLPWAIAAAAVLVLALSVFSNLGSDAPGASPLPIARIAERSGSVTWIGDGGRIDESPEAGDELTGGTLEAHTMDSLAEIVFVDGSSVWVTGPAVLIISDGEEGKMIRVREGDLSLDVASQPVGQPLRVITPSAEAVVLGTQFNISAGSASTSLTVNEGKVRVTRLADGSVQEVAANHRVVAALEQESDFEALPRGDSARVWKAALPGDARKGEWRASAGALRAEAHLFRGDRGMRIDPILLHSVVVKPSDEPVVLSEGAHIQIRGRLERDFKVNIGFGTHFARGGFAGKYALVRAIDIEVGNGSDRSFELDLPLEEFARSNHRFPSSSSGQELVWLWIQTVKQDAGLEVLSVELLSDE